MSHPYDKTRHRHTVEHHTEERKALLRPPKKTFKESFQDFFWDKEKKTCLTRTPVNWCAIMLYYSLFVGGVILIFYISMVIAEAVASKDSDKPMYVLKESWIGESPSLNFFPMKGSKNLIWLNNRSNYNDYARKVTKEFKCYKKKNKNFNVTQFGACSKPPYGYKEKTPCLFFRLNRILMWKPKPYRQDDTLPDDMPQSVKDLIQKSSSRMVWFSCNGTTAKDRDHIKQSYFQIQGTNGFDPSAFPFQKQSDFVDPIIAMQFKDEKPQRVLYTFTCTAWAKRLDRDKSKVDVNYYFD